MAGTFFLGRVKGTFPVPLIGETESKCWGFEVALHMGGPSLVKSQQGLSRLSRDSCQSSVISSN